MLTAIFIVLMLYGGFRLCKVLFVALFISPQENLSATQKYKGEICNENDDIFYYDYLEGSDDYGEGS